MSQGKGDRNRSTGPNYAKGYLDINWDNKKKVKVIERRGPRTAKQLTAETRFEAAINNGQLDKLKILSDQEINEINKSVDIKTVKPYHKLNCIASDKCQTNKEVNE